MSYDLTLDDIMIPWLLFVDLNIMIYIYKVILT